MMREVAPGDLVQTPLRGHSGAVITLCQDGNHSFVRKMAGRLDINDRLRGQFEKQRRFAEEGVRTAQILDCGFIGGHFYFDMRYIPGISVAADASSGSLAAIGNLARFMQSWLDRMAVTVDGHIDENFIVNKLVSIEDRCKSNYLLDGRYIVIENIISYLKNMCWPIMPKSNHHGDLTLENIIIGADGNFYLIDFDVPDIPSLWMDIGKIYQDLLGHWCIRALAINCPGDVAHITAVQALHRLRVEIDGVVGRVFPNLLLSMPKLVVLNLMRTLPYTNDPAVVDFVLQRVAALLEWP